MRLTACATLIAVVSSGCIHYRERAIDPARQEAEYRNRSLSDTALRRFVRANSEQSRTTWPPKSFDLPLLTLIAFYYSPDLEVARAGIALADAEILSAGARINPSVSSEGGYNGTPDSVPLYGILPSFTIETAGKRGLRILQAQKNAEAARIALSETAWHVHSRVRAALINHVLARLKYGQMQDEESIRAEIVEIFDARLASGEAPRPELDVFRVDLISTQAALKAAEGEIAQSLAMLATSIGLTSAALDDRTIDIPSIENPPSIESLSLQRVQRAGLLNRTDIRRTLVEYAAAEAALRLEVARQYPDVQLAPGYSFEEGAARYAIGAALGSLPLYHHNQGPIAVAEAHRRQVEAQFDALQSQVIGEMDRTVVQYRAALGEFNEATRMLATQKEREAAVRKAFASGEEDRLGLATVRLQSAAAARARLDALARVQTALGALEDALEYPLESGLPLPAPPPIDPVGKGNIR